MNKTNKELEAMSNEQLVLLFQEVKLYKNKIQGLLRYRIKNEFGAWE